MLSMLADNSKLIQKADGEDAGEQRQRGDTDNRDNSAENFADGGDRHHIAIADRRQRLDRPPHRSRNRTEYRRLLLTLDDIRKSGADGQRQGEDEDERADRRRLLPEYRPEQIEYPGMAGQLDHSQK